MTTEYQIEIRRERLQPGAFFLQPTGPEIRDVIRRLGMTASGVASFLGLSSSGGRQIRRWISEKAAIPYSAWAILCEEAGLGRIWSIRETDDKNDAEA